MNKNMMEATMEAKVKMSKLYDITINGIEYKGCVKISEWEGMTLFKTQKKQKIILEDKEFFSIFNFYEDNIFKAEVIKMPDGIVGEKNGTS